LFLIGFKALMPRKGKGLMGELKKFAFFLESFRDDGFRGDGMVFY
jgi:hypothetical protein